jgi:hypothetical protein
VAWLKKLKKRFSKAKKFVLRGHHAMSVDFPALALLCTAHCAYDLEQEFEWQDSRFELASAYQGISCSLWNLVKFEAEVALQGSPIKCIWEHETKHRLAHKSAAFDSTAELFVSLLVVRRKVDTDNDEVSSLQV